MRRFRSIPILAIVALLAAPASVARAAGLVSGSYTLNWTQDVQKTVEYKNSRTLKETLETKYVGFLSPIVNNEITLKIEYDKSPGAETKIRFYPTITLAYRGAYWNAGSKRSITREPDTNQKVTDSHFVEVLYAPPRSGMPDLKAKYTADFDVQSGSTDKFKQDVTLSSAYQPLEWLSIKGDYNWTSDDERFRKTPPDPGATPVAKGEKYSFTVGVRHFFSDKLKLNSEWKSEFARNASFFDNGVAKIDSNKEDQTHTMKNAVAFRPFRGTSVDLNYDFDLKQTMIPKVDPILGGLEEHTLTYNAGAKFSQKIGSPIELKGEFTRAKTDVRHSALPSVNTDDGWAVDIKGDFAKQLVLTGRYATHDILNESPGRPDIIPKRTGNVVRSLGWTGDLMTAWKPSANYDRTDTYDFTVDRGRFLSTVEAKYALKGPIDLKPIDLLIEPSYDITIRDDHTNVDPAQQETIDIRDFKVHITKILLATRTINVKIDHSYDRKIEAGHHDPTVNNIVRTDSSTGNLEVKDVVPNFTGGIDFTRSATDTSGDALGPDVTENFTFKIDYKYSAFSWNASYKYDRNLAADKTNKWTFDWRGNWTANKWDFTLTINRTKTLTVLLPDESYKVGVDFKYNF